MNHWLNVRARVEPIAIEKKDSGIAIAVNTQNWQAEPHPRIIQIAVEAEDAVTAIQNFKSGIVIGVTQ